MLGKVKSFVFFPVIILVASLCFCISTQAETHPNEIMVLADDLGVGEISATNPNCKSKDAGSSSSFCMPRLATTLVDDRKQRLKNYQAELWKNPEQRIQFVAHKMPRHHCPKSVAVRKQFAGKRRPNFIIIFTDDQGYQDVGCFGSPDIETPRLDRMAKEGMRFTNFYAQTVCGPSRAALMTGCYPLRVARHADPNSIHPELHLGEITIAELLKPSGYATATIGKWDLAGHNPSKFKRELLPMHQGFDEYFGTPGSNDQFVKLLRGEKKIEDKANMATLTRRYTDEAIDFIERKKNEPFFLYLAHTMPHTKLAASKAFKGTSAAGLYGDVIEELDFNIGRVLDCIQNQGLDDNTYVVFTSDNGPWLIRSENGGHAKPLRSGKTSFWEGGFRVPCIVRAPGKVPAASECNTVTGTIDLLPTIASLSGTQTPTDRVIDGVDLSHLLHGQKSELEREFFYYQHDCLRAVRNGKWKLILPHSEPAKHSISKRWNRHIDKVDAAKIVQHQLFDLDADPGETTDVASQNPQVVQAMKKIAEEARSDIGDHDRFGTNARTFGAKRRTLSDLHE